MGIFFPEYKFNTQYAIPWSIMPPCFNNHNSWPLVFPPINFSFTGFNFYPPTIFYKSDDNKTDSSVDNFQISTNETSSQISSSTNFQLKLTQKNQNELSRIKDIFNKNQEKYKEVERATGVPAELICAIHYRESGCKFTTYLHNGDPLGKPTVHVPRGKLFYDWTSAAIDALKNRHYGKVSKNDIDSQLNFAERYNGLGYKRRGIASPYVWSGTDKYTQGMYVADGKFNPNAKDKRVGVAAILDSLYTA